MRPRSRITTAISVARQLLLGRERCGVADAVGRVVALQAQDAASPYLALWNRIEAFDPDDLTAAYADHRVLKAPLMRITLHAVRAEDYPAFRRAMVSSLRASRVGDRRFRVIGVLASTGSGLGMNTDELAIVPVSAAHPSGAACRRQRDRQSPRSGWQVPVSAS